MSEHHADPAFAAAMAEHERLTAELATARAAVSEMADKLIEAEAQLEQLEAKEKAQVHQIAALDAQIAEKTLELEGNGKDIVGLRQQHAALVASQDVERRVATQLIKLSVRPMGVGGGGSANERGMTLEAIRQQLDATSDPVERARLARRARELRGQGGMFEN